VVWRAGRNQQCSYAKFRSRSHGAVIRVYDDASNVVETVIATEITRLLMSFFGGD
jgi:hypothetical protein